jgi:hypothetical protein
MAGMKQADIAAMIDTINTGDEFRIVFSPTAESAEATYLLGMRNATAVTLSAPGNPNEGDLLTLSVVASGEGWGSLKNRTYTLMAGPAWDAQWFKGRFLRRLENIVMVSPPEESGPVSMEVADMRDMIDLLQHRDPFAVVLKETARRRAAVHFHLAIMAGLLVPTTQEQAKLDTLKPGASKEARRIRFRRGADDEAIAALKKALPFIEAIEVL